MILIVSHFAKNRGTTDFFIDYLLKERRDFYLLKHPFTFTDITVSELYLYSNGTPSLVGSYKKVNSDILNLIKDFFVSVLVSFKLRGRVDKVIGFGSFNVAPFILTNFFKRKVFFWGVDYSRERFANLLLNRIYLALETLACGYSTFIINQSRRQEDARIKHHHLNRSKSFVSSNGINIYPFAKTSLSHLDSSLLYIGSITNQHGIVDFVDFFYVQNDLPFPLHIIGSGEDDVVLQKTIQKAVHPGKIIYVGFKNQQEIQAYIESNKLKSFGIAPYSDTVNDHVYYGDSIKIKEYLAYDMPFITSNIAYIPNDLKPFGIVYASFPKLLSKLTTDLSEFSFDKSRKDEILKHYTWNVLFDRVTHALNI